MFEFRGCERSVLAPFRPVIREGEYPSSNMACEIINEDKASWVNSTRRKVDTMFVLHILNEKKLEDEDVLMEETTEDHAWISWQTDEIPQHATNRC